MATCGEVLGCSCSRPMASIRSSASRAGGHTVELHLGLPATRIRHVTPRHEQGAGFMADGNSRLSGRPGVCFIITGPGTTHILTAMGQAIADSVPRLVISSVNCTEQLGMGQGRLHELRSQRNVVAGVAAFSHTTRYRPRWARARCCTRLTCRSAPAGASGTAPRRPRSGPAPGAPITSSSRTR
jgi:acetolactate synthase I/II/III large subunit